MDPVAEASYLALGGRDLFFHPGCHGLARNAEGTGNTAQTTALVQRVEDFRPTFLGIAVRCRVFTTATPTRMTLVALLPIRGTPVADQLVAPTMDACHRRRLLDHLKILYTIRHVTRCQYTIVPEVEPLPCHTFG